MNIETQNAESRRQVAQGVEVLADTIRGMSDEQAEVMIPVVNKLIGLLNDTSADIRQSLHPNIPTNEELARSTEEALTAHDRAMDEALKRFDGVIATLRNLAEERAKTRY